MGYGFSYLENGLRTIDGTKLPIPNTLYFVLCLLEECGFEDENKVPVNTSNAYFKLVHKTDEKLKVTISTREIGILSISLVLDNYKSSLKFDISNKDLLLHTQMDIGTTILRQIRGLYVFSSKHHEKG